MKFLSCVALLLTLAAAKSPHCASPATKDVELFVTMETTDADGYPHIHRYIFGSAFETFGQWLAENDRSLTVSYGRAGLNSEEVCHKQDLLQKPYTDLRAVMEPEQYWLSPSHSDDTTVLNSVVWASRYLWKDQPSSDVRRLFVLITARYPGEPMESDLTFTGDEEDLALTLEASCPLPGQAPAAQVAEAVQQSGAGIFLYHHVGSAAMGSNRTAWESYFEKAGITDVIYQYTYAIQVFTESFVAALAQMTCPEWQQGGNAADHLVECADEVSHCSPLWRDELADCLSQRTN